MSFTLTVLGSSSALPTSTRFPTAQVLNVHERFFLIDCGEGTQIQLRRFSINMSKINHIFISHLHGDHIFGLYGLFSSYNLMGRKKDLHVFAHHDFAASLEHFNRYFGLGMSYQVVHHPFTPSRPGLIYEDRQLSVEIIPLRHSIPVAGFVFREKQRLLNIRKDAIAQYGLGIGDIRKIKEGQDFVTPEGITVPSSELTLPAYQPRSYAFCTDTSCFSKLQDYLRDMDLLYFEATFAEKDRKLAKQTGHSTAVQAAKLARESRVGKLLIGHFSTRYKHVNLLINEAREIFPETYGVEDGEKYPVSLQRIGSGA